MVGFSSGFPRNMYVLLGSERGIRGEAVFLRANQLSWVKVDGEFSSAILVYPLDMRT